MIFNAGGTIPNETVLLWTNDNPESHFYEQTIDIDTSKYSMFFVVASRTTSSTYSPVGIVMNTNDNNTSSLQQIIRSTDGEYTYYRYVTIDESGITFSTGHVGGIGDGTSGNPTVAVPLYIYGCFNLA